MSLPAFHLPPDDTPALRDVLTDDGRELPLVALTSAQLAEVQAFTGSWGEVTDPMTCTCGHTIADHTPVTDEWLIGARTVTETREQCAKCDCDDFEEEAHA